MKFSVNSPILFVLVGIIIAAVLGQSVYFLIRAVKRAKILGITTETVKKTVTSAALFTVAPAIAILVGVIALSKSLGIAVPWLRLSVIGSLSYETVAAGNALSALGQSMAEKITSVDAFATVVAVMTVGILPGILLTPLLTKKIQKGLTKINDRDKHWGDILSNAMFIGMISAFLGYVFCDVSGVFSGSTAGLVPVCVMAISAVIMAVCGLFAIKLKQNWMKDYALPLSLIIGMASAIPLTAWLG